MFSEMTLSIYQVSIICGGLCLTTELSSSRQHLCVCFTDEDRLREAFSYSHTVNDEKEFEFSFPSLSVPHT